VWDVLAHLEQGRLHDAHLLKQAKQFKDVYLKKIAGDITEKSVREAWTDWKNVHGQPELPFEKAQKGPIESGGKQKE
jgi:hypothetical protein